MIDKQYTPFERKQYHKFRSCDRKKKLSLALADGMVTDSLYRGLILYYYECKYCGKYHLTKSPPGKR